MLAAALITIVTSFSISRSTDSSIPKLWRRHVAGDEVDLTRSQYLVDVAAHRFLPHCNGLVRSLPYKRIDLRYLQHDGKLVQETATKPPVEPVRKTTCLEKNSIVTEG